MRKILAIVLLLSTWVFALPAGLNTIVKKSGIPSKDISIYIKEAGKNNKRVVASLNASTARTPASVIKVLSTYAALLKLGFDYRWPTEFYTKGQVKNGVLNGDLIVKGYGDPTLSTKHLASIVDRIKAKGIRKITGNIVIDRSYFAVGNKNNSGFDKHTYSPYNAMPDAMMFNERISTICVTPKKNAVTKKVPDGSYVIQNKLQRVNKPCKGRYSWPGLRIDEKSATTQVILRGKISKNCGTRNLCQVITKPYKSFYYALKDALNKKGVKVSGGMRLNKVPKGAKKIFTHYSYSLEKIISRTAKKSNNLYARHLLLFLGAKMYGAPATLSKGRQAVEYILKSRGALPKSTLSIDNGCGLSRTAKLNAKLLASVLDDGYTRYGMRWMKTLSIAGVDGTIRRRFRGTVVRNRAWMKTGTLKRVKNISGYVKSKNGRYYTTVILVNSKAGNWKASQLQNRVIKWLVGYKGRGVVVNEPLPLPTKKSAAAKKKVLSKNTESYYIQAGSFSRKPTASYLAKLSELGLSYETKGEKNYKVMVGPYLQESKARSVLKTVREHLNSGAFLVTSNLESTKGAEALY